MRKWTGLAAASVSLVAPIFLMAGTAHAATPVAIWHMDKTSSMADSSGSNNNGTTKNITSVPDGVSGPGYHFASNSSVQVPSSASLNPGTANFTISMNVRFGAAPAAGLDYDLIRKGLSTTTGGEWKIEIFGNSTLTSPAFCLFKDGAKVQATVRGTTNLADNKWHRITCAKTASAVTLTVDNVLQRTNRMTLGPISNTDPVGVGRKLPSGDQYVGDMDEITIQSGP